jgi:hypothetical protein
MRLATEGAMIVGFGAPAGGSHARKACAGVIPAALVSRMWRQPLSSSRSAMVDARLTPKSSAPVRGIAVGDAVAPDTVWIFPADPFLEIEDRHLRPPPNQPEKGRRSSIERIFSAPGRFGSPTKPLRGADAALLTMPRAAQG